jgi:hydroxypyruvate isomerase
MKAAFSAHISWLFAELPYLERVPAARAAGFGWIETAWPAADDRAALPDVVAAEGVGVALLNMDAGEVARGERGFLNDPARRAESELAFLAAADLAGRIGAPCLNLLVGRELAGAPLARQRDTLLANLRCFGPEAAARGLRLLIEPVNALDNPGYLAPTAQDAADLIQTCGCDSVRLLLDIYHVARGGQDPVAEIERHAALIGHVQLADHPGRGQPGSGELDIEAILGALDAAGYAGCVGLEYEPSSARSDSAPSSAWPVRSTSSSLSAVHSPNSPPTP